MSFNSSSTSHSQDPTVLKMFHTRSVPNGIINLCGSVVNWEKRLTSKKGVTNVIVIIGQTRL
jgi:hypothetical protein